LSTHRQPDKRYFCEELGMSDNGQSFDISGADQLGFGLLADGDDLFDLSHMAVAETAPTGAMTAGATMTGALASDLVALETDGHGGHETYLQVAGLDEAQLVYPPLHSVVDSPAHDQLPVSQLDHVTADHASALALADILSDAADGLASFHTAAGGSAGGGHVPMGSGLFTPFHPIEPLGGINELQVISTH
jgi:hypothetical protein